MGTQLKHLSVALLISTHNVFLLNNDKKCTDNHLYTDTGYKNKILYKNSAEGVIAPAGAKVTGATIRTWLLNKFISFLAVLSWKTGLKKM